MAQVTILEEHRSFGGVQGFYEHESAEIGLPMRFGDDRSQWAQHDAVLLIASGARCAPILADQGLKDPFLAQQLKPERPEQACADAGQLLTLRRHPEYDHGYFFIASFVSDHLAHHARALLG